MKNPNNPPAFPCFETASETVKGEEYPRIIEHKGLTIRDYFAAKALPEIIRQWTRWEKSIDYKEMNQGDADNIAEQSYAIADAMLKQREL